MINKRWQLYTKISKKDIKRFPEIHPVVLQLLYNRNIKSQEAIDEFLNPDYSADLHDPFIFNDMEKTCARIEKAVSGKEKILIWGDYDADGISATALMALVLEKLGCTDFEIFIPEREEGYGLNNTRLEKFIKKGINLIITVDCGISDKDPISLAKENKIDVIITDHHQQPKELPTDAYAIINPQVKTETYPFKSLAGVGVAFKVAQALVKRNDLSEAFEKWLLDLVAIGTVADVMPVIGENRTLVKYGIVVLRKTSRAGIRELVKKMRADLSNIESWQLSWQLGPRLNACGRIKNAIISYELLKTESVDEARKYADTIEEYNCERQRMTEIIMEDVNQQLDLDRSKTKEKVLFAYNETWPSGMVGLVAGKLKDHYWRPFFVITKDNGKIKGSCRSIDGYNIYNTVKQVDDLFSEYGGHEAACGFTLKSSNMLEEFKKRISKIVNSNLKEEDIVPIIDVDMEIDLESIDWDLYGILEEFSPYGEGNWQPKYFSKNLEVVSIDRLGKDQSHLRLSVKHNSNEVKKMIGFKFGDFSEKISIGDMVDIVFEVGINEWNGNRELEIKIIDIKITKLITKNTKK